MSCENTPVVPAWKRIEICRDETLSTLKDLSWTVVYSHQKGDPKLIQDMAGALGSLKSAVDQLDDYLALLGKVPGTGHHDTSTGTVDVPERDSGGTGDDGGSGSGLLPETGSSGG